MKNLTSELTFRVIVVILYLPLAIIRVYYGRKTQQRASWKNLKETAERIGKLSYVLLCIVIPLFIAFFFLYVICPEWMSWFSLPFPVWLRWIGVGLGTISLPLLLWVHKTLGEHWSKSLEIREQHNLITDGPYRWVRHPMYSVLFAFMIAISFVSANCLIALSTVILIVLIFNVIIKEERMMIERFGDQYHAYMKRTGRLLPRIGYDNYDNNDQKNKKMH